MRIPAPVVTAARGVIVRNVEANHGEVHALGPAVFLVCVGWPPAAPAADDVAALRAANEALKTD
jgi:hypothetical protein